MVNESEGLIISIPVVEIKDAGENIDITLDLTEITVNQE